MRIHLDQPFLVNNKFEKLVKAMFLSGDTKNNQIILDEVLDPNDKTILFIDGETDF